MADSALAITLCALTAFGGDGREYTMTIHLCLLRVEYDHRRIIRARYQHRHERVLDLDRLYPERLDCASGRAEQDREVPR